MPAPLITILAITLLGAMYVTFPIIVDYYRRYRATKIVKCPETGDVAEVETRALRAAFASLGGTPQLRVKNCTLWPRKRAVTKLAFVKLEIFSASVNAKSKEESPSGLRLDGVRCPARFARSPTAKKRFSTEKLVKQLKNFVEGRV